MSCLLLVASAPREPGEPAGGVSTEASAVSGARVRRQHAAEPAGRQARGWPASGQRQELHAAAAAGTAVLPLAVGTAAAH